MVYPIYIDLRQLPTLSVHVHSVHTVQQMVLVDEVSLLMVFQLNTIKCFAIQIALSQIRNRGTYHEVS